MECLKSKTFSNGMKKKIKSICLGTYTIEYSNCSKEQLEKEIIKLEKVFNCVLYLGWKWGATSTIYTIECYNMKGKYQKMLDKEIYL